MQAHTCIISNFEAFYHSIEQKVNKEISLNYQKICFCYSQKYIHIRLHEMLKKKLKTEVSH